MSSDPAHAALERRLEVESRLLLAEGVLPPSQIRAAAVTAITRGVGLIAILRGEGRLPAPVLDRLEALAVQLLGPEAPLRPAGIKDLAPGSSFAGCQILSIIARGGMGLVLHGRDLESGHEVALKVLFCEDDATNAERRFRREAKVLESLRHDHIVRLLRSGEDRGRLYLVLDFIKGRDLETLVKERRRAGDNGLDPLDLAELLAPIADALAYCHTAGIVHRDVKPSNIIVEDTTGRPILVDFGVMKQLAGDITISSASGSDVIADALSLSGDIVGTPAFLSPEQVDPRSELTMRSDVWGLGATLFNALTGRLPFDVASTTSFYIALLERDAPRLRTIDRAIPVWLDELCAACLQRDPERRPEMAEIAEALRTRGRSFRARSRSRALPLVGVGVLIVLALITALTMAGGRPEVDRGPLREARTAMRARIERLERALLFGSSPADLTPVDERRLTIDDRARLDSLRRRTRALSGLIAHASGEAIRRLPGDAPPATVAEAWLARLTDPTPTPPSGRPPLVAPPNAPDRELAAIANAELALGEGRVADARARFLEARDALTGPAGWCCGLRALELDIAQGDEASITQNAERCLIGLAALPPSVRQAAALRLLALVRPSRPAPLQTLPAALARELPEHPLAMALQELEREHCGEVVELLVDKVIAELPGRLALNALLIRAEARTRRLELAAAVTDYESAALMAGRLRRPVAAADARTRSAAVLVGQLDSEALNRLLDDTAPRGDPGAPCEARAHAAAAVANADLEILKALPTGLSRLGKDRLARISGRLDTAERLAPTPSIRRRRLALAILRGRTDALEATRPDSERPRTAALREVVRLRTSAADRRGANLERAITIIRAGRDAPRPERSRRMAAIGRALMDRARDVNSRPAELDRAAEALHLALSTDPLDPILLSTFRRLARARRKPDEEIAIGQAAYVLDPYDPVNWHLYIESLKGGARTLDLLGRAVSVDQRDPRLPIADRCQMLQQLADASMRSNKLLEASRTLLEASRLIPQRVGLYRRLLGDQLGPFLSEEQRRRLNARFEALRQGARLASELEQLYQRDELRGFLSRRPSIDAEPPLPEESEDRIEALRCDLLVKSRDKEAAVAWEHLAALARVDLRIAELFAFRAMDPSLPMIGPELIGHVNRVRSTRLASRPVDVPTGAEAAERRRLIAADVRACFDAGRALQALAAGRRIDELDRIEARLLAAARHPLHYQGPRLLLALVLTLRGRDADALFHFGLVEATASLRMLPSSGLRHMVASTLLERAGQRTEAERIRRLAGALGWTAPPATWPRSLRQRLFRRGE